MKTVTRSQPLTADEAAEYASVRQEIEREEPDLSANIRHQLAERRRAEAKRAGAPTFGQRLRTARENRRLSQVKLAHAARISQGYLSQLEQDEREPTLSIAVRLATALGVTLDELATSAGEQGLAAQAS